MKLIIGLILLFASGCVTTPRKVNQQVVENQTLKFEKIIKDLDRQINYVEYENMNNLCFLTKDICDLKGFQTCSSLKFGSKKCLESKEKLCFKKHEDCIINNYRRWESIKKSRGF